MLKFIKTAKTLTAPNQSPFQFKYRVMAGDVELFNGLVLNRGEIIINENNWEMFIGDGLTPVTKLSPFGILPEYARAEYRA